MKVVLLKDVKDLGRAHNEIEVSDGHALNFLIPKKMAVAATARARKEAELRLRQVKERKELDHKLIEERLAALAEGALMLSKRANEKGHLYDAVDARELAELSGIPAEAISLPKPIKELGTFDIPVAYGENFGSFKIVIEAA